MQMYYSNANRNRQEDKLINTWIDREKDKEREKERGIDRGREIERDKD